MPSPPQISEAAGKRYALIIGVDRFRDAAIPALRYAKNDAAALRDFLLHPALGKFQRENVHVLLDDEATLGDVRSQFVYWLGAKAQEEDEVWVYFAGYGATLQNAGERGPRQYLVLHDSAPGDLAQSGLSMEQLHEWLGLIPTRRVVIIFDCSFGGGNRGRTLATGKAARANDYAELSALAQEHRGLALLAASSNESAREDDEAELGLFTRILLQRMRATLLTNYGGEKTWEALAQFLASEVARQADLRGAAQTPVKLGDVPKHVTIFEAPPPIKPRPIAAAENFKSTRVQQLLHEAQEEIYADNLSHARELLLEIVELDAANRRAATGLRKLDEILQQGASRETQIKQAFAQARRYWDERNYEEALHWYEKARALDPTSESARVGIETCEAMLRKQKEENFSNGQMIAARAEENPSHGPKLIPYEEFIWPYVGWWALVGAVWGLFGTHMEGASNAAIFVNVVKHGFFGALIGLVHASAVYFYKLTDLRMKAKKTKRA